MARKLGQHFLKDKRALQKIAGVLEINSRDTIVEIGPGHGELTRYLLEAAPKKVVAIEKDKRMAASLEKNLQLSPQASGHWLEGMEIIEGDVLKILPDFVWKLSARGGSASGGKNENWKLVGNIPYYITGHLLRKISELAHSADAQGKRKMPKLIVFTIQKEVAERICAEPPKMNLLAASVQFWGAPKIVGLISKKSFRPPPKVDSAIIKIIPSNLTSHDGLSAIKGEKGINPEGYYRLIKILFKQPRKTVLNNLRAGLKTPEEKLVNTLDKTGVKPSSRPQNLAIKDIQAISRVLRRLKEL